MVEDYFAHSAAADISTSDVSSFEEIDAQELTANDTVEEAEVRTPKKTPEIVKDYKYYLDKYSRERSPSYQVKSLPDLTQLEFIQFCKTLYNMFRDNPKEQDLYHAIATVASLLLQLGEVGKQFKKNKEQKSPKHDNDVTTTTSSQSRPTSTSSVDQVNASAQKLSLEGTGNDDVTDGNQSPTTPTTPASPTFQQDTNSPLGDGTTPPGADDSVPPPSPSKYKNPDIDLDWSVSCEQIIASVLTEPALCEFFEQKHSITDAIANIRLNRKKF